MIDDQDEKWMRRCLELARRAEGRTAPNPIVGCVIVGKTGRLLAEGFHQKAGLAHAEAVALGGLAPGRARGATVYTNLEPCNHRGPRRTSACAPALIAAGVGRVVYGMRDPIPSHSGGALNLARRGIEVVSGVLAQECLEANLPFVFWARQRRPRFVLKAAISLDGRIATAEGESQWITGAVARRDSQRLRDTMDSVLVGVGTVLADNPRLTCRIRGGRDPIRVIVDSQLRTPLSSRILPANSSSPATTIVACTHGAPDSREKKLRARGAVVWRLPATRRGVSLVALSRKLAGANIMSTLAEGGAHVHASLVAAALADEVILYQAPIVIGDRNGVAAPSWLADAGVATLSSAPRFVRIGPPKILGDDVRCVFRPAPTKGRKRST